MSWNRARLLAALPVVVAAGGILLAPRTELSAGTLDPSAATIEITVTGEDIPGGSTNMSVPLKTFGDISRIDPAAMTDGLYVFEMQDAFRVELGPETYFDPDPEIGYFGAVQDPGAPSSFAFVFSQGIVPTAAPGAVSHSNSTSTSDPNNNGLTVTALAPPGGIPTDSDGNTEIFVYTLSQNGGGSFLSADHDLRQTFSTPSGPPTSDSQPALEESGFGPAVSGNYDFMRVDANFSLSGGGDIFTFSGVARVVVPEPNSLALALLGFVSLALFFPARTRPVLRR